MDNNDRFKKINDRINKALNYYQKQLKSASALNQGKIQSRIDTLTKYNDVFKQNPTNATEHMINRWIDSERDEGLLQGFHV